MSSSNSNDGNKSFGFSLKLGAKNNGKKPATAAAAVLDDYFEAPQREPDEKQVASFSHVASEPLIIPVQQDERQTLQEQAKQKREHELSKEDQEAIKALTSEQDATNTQTSTNKMVIPGSQNTFQNQQQPNSTDVETKQFQDDLQRLAPEVSVDSQVYQQVPIADFGAAMLRGMGWTGAVNTTETSNELPRPSRLGLGATPKLLLDDSKNPPPTHKPRRPDQVKRQEQLQQQEKEYEKQRNQQVKMDKQRTLQEGSIVFVLLDDDQRRRRRGKIRKWQGVPGLNQCLIQWEASHDTTSVRKGDVTLVDRDDLHQYPFQEPVEPDPEESSSRNRKSRSREKDEDDRRRRRRRHHHPDDDDDDDPHEDRRRKRREEEDDDRRRHRDRKRRHDDDDDHRRESHDRKRRHREEPPSPDQPRSWLIPHIRVRVITRKFGKQFYKEKGIVVDVTRKGTATMTMDSDNAVLQIPERYLETALPKVGGKACILMGKHQYAKGKLLERDSKTNRGSVQIYEDMSIVTTRLDDMAEWCGPLDDDFME